MDLLKKYTLNKSDIKDLLIYLDKAIKIRLQKEGFYESRYVPKIYLGESREYLDNENQTPYERPFITLNVSRRGPASLSDKNFFSGQLQHSPGFKIAVDKDKGIYKQLLLRDNEIKLYIRAKTKSEIYFLQQILERVMIYEQKWFENCSLIRFIESKDRFVIKEDLYEAEFIFRARTQVEVLIKDDAILETVNIIYKNTLCKYFDVYEHKCVYYDMFGSLPECSFDNEEDCRPPGTPEHAQREEEANDIDCYLGKEWCTEHENISVLKVKG
jgi:hypothetical protein